VNLARLPRVNAFHVCGALFAIWALVASFLGITRESFPSTDGAARAVGAVSVVLCIAAIGTAIYTSATEEHESEEEGEEQALGDTAPRALGQAERLQLRI
jgi:hypothetical protein